MAETNETVRVLEITHGDVYALVLAEVTVRSAAEYLRLGRYEPTEEQLATITRACCRWALARGPELAAVATGRTDAEELEAAESTGREAVLAALGPPAREAMN